MQAESLHGHRVKNMSWKETLSYKKGVCFKRVPAASYPFLFWRLRVHGLSVQPGNMHAESIREDTLNDQSGYFTADTTRKVLEAS